MTTITTKDIRWYPQVSKAKLISYNIEVDILNTAIKRSVSRKWVPTTSVVYEEPLPIISVDNKRSFDSSDQCADGWIALIREELYANPSVEDIFVSIEDNNVDVWVVIPKRDISVLRQLVEGEGRIVEMLVSGKHPAFLIDFHIVYRSGRNLEELAPTRAIRLPR